MHLIYQNFLAKALIKNLILTPIVMIIQAKKPRIYSRQILVSLVFVVFILF